MDTFSLLQVSLDQTIDRGALEDASDAVRSIARADCAKIQHELFGIVVAGLERNEALAFQAALQQRDFPTEVVADRELPLLHESLQIQRIDHRDEVLILTDSMGHVRTRPLTDLVFLAAGFLKRPVFKSDWNLKVTPSWSIRGGMPEVEIEPHSAEETELEFRLDYFFWCAPNRLDAVLAMDTAIFHQGKPLRLHDDDALNTLLAAMANLLPRERLSSGLLAPEKGRFYPNFRCYEEEIRWHFHRLTPRV